MLLYFKNKYTEILAFDVRVFYVCGVKETKRLKI